MIRTVPTYGLTWLFDFDPTTGGGVSGTQYAFGINTSDNSFWFHVGPHPTDWIKIGSGGGGVVLGVDLEDEGAPVAGNPHSTLNFVGAGVTATDSGGVGTITIPGASVLGVDLQDEGVPVANNPHATLNFVGDGVAVSDVAGVGTVTIPGGGSGPQVFEYTVTGAEPVLSELVIPIPVATADTSYGVVATCQGCSGIVPFDIPGASKTTTQFVAIATGDLTAGDVIAFFLSPLT